jgi:hypothetical protein
MKKHEHRPACFTSSWPVSARAPGFWDDGRACGNSLSPKLWDIALHHTPGCLGCTRALRGLLIWQGPNWWPRSAARRAGFPWPLPFDTTDITSQEDAAP